MSRVDPEIEGILDVLDTQPLPEEMLQCRELCDIVGAAMSSLQPIYRSVLELKYVTGLKVNEIAEQLTRSPKAVESLLARAREAFRKTFELIVKGHLSLGLDSEAAR